MKMHATARCHACTTRVAQSGLALVVVVWLVALLSLMALSLTVLQRSEVQLTGNLVESAKAHAAAEAGIQLALLDLFRPPAARQLSLDGVRHEARFDGARLMISVVDEAGKIDLNFASGPLLDALLSGAGVDDELARAQLVDAILDWRDSDELRRIHGAEAEEYRASGVGYLPRNGHFQSVEELALVMGMSAPLYHRLAGAVTIFSGARTLNPDSSALLLRTFPEIDEASLLTVYDDLHGEALPAAIASGRAAARGGVFTIHSEALLASGAQVALETVVRLIPRRGNAVPLFETVVWREMAPANAAESVALHPPVL